jgi:hypothetical protein
MKKKILVGLMCLALLTMALPYVANAQEDVGLREGLETVEDELVDSLAAGETDPRAVAAKIINIALGFLGIVAVILVLYGGFMWMTAAGNEERVTKAKQILTAALIGLIIIIMAWALTRFVMDQLMNVTGMAS